MEGRELTDRYRLERILTSSPATTVMAAVEAATGRQVVVKLIHPRSAAGIDIARSRFAHWTSTLRSLSHPALPAVVEAGFTPEGSAFLVVERLGGRSLAAAAPSPRRAAEYLATVGEALALLAKRGLAHGNLTADNLWVAFGGDGGEQVKLQGLGTAPFRGGEVGNAAIAADAEALAALRATFAPADALAAEREEAAARLEPADEPEAEVLPPVDERLLQAPPEPPAAPAEPSELGHAPAVQPGSPPRRPRALWGGLAAATLLALVAAFVLFGDREDPPPPSAAVPAPVPAAPAPRTPVPADLAISGDDAHVREWAAAGFEARAAARARVGEYAAALAAVERGWPERAGLTPQLATVRAHRDAEPAQQALLETLPGFERRGKPAEGLAELAGVEPTPHLAPAFAEVRRRLEEQLAGLDREPPVVELRDGYLLQYARGTVAELSFRVRDDYAVEGVRIFVRPPGGSFRELPHTRSAFGYTVEIGPAFHRNGTVELFVTATDLSGHEGRLGSRERPLLLTRTQDFEPMLGH